MSSAGIAASIALIAAAAGTGCIGQGSGDPLAQTASPGSESAPAGQAAGNTPAPAAAAENDTSETTPPVVKSYSGSAAGVSIPGSFSIASTSTDMEFPVAAGATAIVIEVAWATSDKLDVEPGIPDPECEAIAPQAPLSLSCDYPPGTVGQPSPVKIVVTDAKYLKHTGNWYIGVYAEQSPTEVPFKAAASVFYGGLPSEAYTALTTA